MIYTNDLRVYMDGAWFAAGGDRLYIIPLGGLKPWGPDDAAMAFLTTVDHKEPRFPRWLEAHGLEEIAPALRRWSPEDGFYSA